MATYGAIVVGVSDAVFSTTLAAVDAVRKAQDVATMTHAQGQEGHWPRAGFELDAALLVPLSEQLSLIPGLRYRYLSRDVEFGDTNSASF